ncbi:MAG: hypothetical protein GX945_13445 [Lentisphaerae bacterium]|jgi:hypothetical protein|nr:hypothetical protein [Lentisphaerota bacterium]
MDDRSILRDLARRYLELCRREGQDELRQLWRRLNSLRPGGRPLIYVRAFAWQEMPESQCQCSDRFLRGWEDYLRRQLFWGSLDDDSIFEPWLPLPATYGCVGWGLAGTRQYSDEPRGSYKVDYPLKELADWIKMRRPRHSIDEEKTRQRRERLEDILGDILPVAVDRSPVYRMWEGDLATALGALRGMENVMLDMMDQPELLHELLAFMRDGILAVHQEAEEGGDWGLTGHQNQAMPYAEELPSPAANVHGVSRKELWGYMAAQELALVSPAMHDEFMLHYQLPILRHFGLVAYGCCEDLTQKIAILRQIPNLRRVAVSPFADVRSCAEQIGRDYVLSYRPSPTDMVGYGFSAERIRSILRRDLGYCRDSQVDITLKDVETVEGDPQRVRKWVEITRDVIDELWG